MTLDERHNCSPETFVVHGKDLHHEKIALEPVGRRMRHRRCPAQPDCAPHRAATSGCWKLRQGSSIVLYEQWPDHFAEQLLVYARDGLFPRILRVPVRCLEKRRGGATHAFTDRLRRGGGRSKHIPHLSGDLAGACCKGGDGRGECGRRCALRYDLVESHCQWHSGDPAGRFGLGRGAAHQTAATLARAAWTAARGAPAAGKCWPPPPVWSPGSRRDLHDARVRVLPPVGVDAEHCPGRQGPCDEKNRNRPYGRLRRRGKKRPAWMEVNPIQSRKTSWKGRARERKSCDVNRTEQGHGSSCL